MYSKSMLSYFELLNERVRSAYSIAIEARKKGLDPSEEVETFLAKNMAERVVGLINSIAPQIRESGMVERITELENQYGKLDWRVACTVGLEVAKEKFCKFKDKVEAMEVGIRVGLAYLTLGVVSSPLEGFTKLEIRKRKDGGDYFALFFSGPIRSSGTTVTCGSILVADYIRQQMGYKEYDPTETEVKRYVTELYDYHERITNLQYLPSEEEIEFMMSNVPVQIHGDASEKIEVSNYKHLERVETNMLRNGVCLVVGEALCQKAKKFWKQVSSWGKDFGLENWYFLKDFLVLQERVRAAGKIQEKKEGIVADYNYIKDIVAGRPVVTHPMKIGGLRLRYGRSRVSGLSSLSIHPATMVVMENYIGTGTQLRYERPGKSTAVAPCDTIEGPIVKLRNGGVIFLESEEKARKHLKEISEVLFLGDILVNYGEFFNRAHVLIPPGYCEEWWLREIERVPDYKEKLKDILNENLTESLLKDCLTHLSFDECYRISKELGVPLHPRYTFHWKALNALEFFELLDWINKGKIERDESKIILPLHNKRYLESIGLPHFVSGEFIIIEEGWAKALMVSLGFYEKDFVLEDTISKIGDSKNILEIINLISEIKLRDKSGTFIGARMGRPEKAKLRKLTGSPQVLFPVGQEGDKLRSFNSALSRGRVSAEFSIYYCDHCKEESVYPFCYNCERKTRKRYFCGECNEIKDKKFCSVHKDKKLISYRRIQLDINKYMKAAMKKLELEEIPSLIKGVRGTSNEDHTPENLVKGLLRTIHNLYVNKDGTIRYDLTEMPLTHFRSIEVGTSISRLKELGYEKDIDGNLLENETQLLEIKPQDIVLPACEESGDEGADLVFFRTASFIDDLLKRYYGLDSFYNLKSKEDLVGHLVIGLAPHISAGIVGRIIGFSKTQCCFASPLWHAAMRRDCFSYDTNIPIYDGSCWNNVKIGEFVETLNPDKIVDNFGTLAKDVSQYKTLAYNRETQKIDIMPIKWFTKHTPNTIYKIKLENGRELKVTLNHRFYVYDNDEILEKKTFNLIKRDKLIVPYNYEVLEKDLDFISIEDYYKDSEYVMINHVSGYVQKKIDELGFLTFCNRFGLNKKRMYNYLRRDNFPICLVSKFLKYFGEDFGDLPENRRISVQRNFVKFPFNIGVDKKLFEIVGFYLAEGHARKKDGKKGYYQVDFAINENDLRNYAEKIIKDKFGLSPNRVGNSRRLTYSSRLLYEFFVDILKVGKGAHSKRVPSIFLNLPKDKISSLISAYFEGDGCVSPGDLRVTCDTVSKGLVHDLEFVLSRFGIYIRKYETEREPGRKIKDFYLRKNRSIPRFRSTKLTIPSNFCRNFYENINFISDKKRNILKGLLDLRTPRGMKIENDGKYAYLKITEIRKLREETTYCLNVPGHHNVLANGIVAKQCEGDETSILLLMDVLLNFSRKYLPAHRGATQDAPLVLTSNLVPSEVDDMVLDMDTVWQYPLEFYEAALNYKYPWEFKMEQILHRLGTERQFEGYGFTHDTENLNAGVRFSAYKFLPTMMEKVRGQMKISEKIRAVDEVDVARLVIDRHFMRDIKGNLRKFSTQQFRCVDCNEKFRRPPLSGICLKCGGKLLFTVSEGSVIKYLKPSLELAQKYNLPSYLKQSLELVQQRIESVFGRDKEKQEALEKWF